MPSDSSQLVVSHILVPRLNIRGDGSVAGSLSLYNMYYTYYISDINILYHILQTTLGSLRLSGLWVPKNTWRFGHGP